MRELSTLVYCNHLHTYSVSRKFGTLKIVSRISAGLYNNIIILTYEYSVIIE